MFNTFFGWSENTSEQQKRNDSLLCEHEVRYIAFREKTHSLRPTQTGEIVIGKGPVPLDTDEALEGDVVVLRNCPFRKLPVPNYFVSPKRKNVTDLGDDGEWIYWSCDLRKKKSC